MTEQERTIHFKYIFQRNYEKLFHYVLYTIGNEEEAKDIIGDVFRKVYENYESVQLDTADSYLFLCTRNHCMDYLRHQKQVNRYAQYYIENQRPGYDTIDNYDDRMDRIMEIINTLPEKTRFVMEQCYLEDRSYKEVADVLGLTTSGVKKHIMKGLDTIRKTLNVNYKKGK